MPLLDWEELGATHSLSWATDTTPRLAAWLLGSKSLGKVISYMASMTLLKCIQDRATLALAFCNAHQAAGQILQRHIGKSPEHKLQGDVCPAEIDLPLAYLSVTDQVLKESRTEVAAAFQFVMDVRDSWPEALTGVKTSQLAREILNDKEAYIKQMQSSGLLSQEEAGELSELVYHNIRALIVAEPHYNIPSLWQILYDNDAFNSLPNNVFRQVWSKVATTSVLAGDTVKANEASVAVLLRGKVYMTEGEAQEDQEQVIDQQRVLLGGGHANSTGSVFSWGFLNEGIHCPWTHVAVTTCLIAYVPKVIIKDLLVKYPAVRDGVWRSLGVAIATWESPPTLTSGYHSLVRIFRTSKAYHLEQDDILPQAANTFTVLSGSLQPYKRAGVYTNQASIHGALAPTDVLDISAIFQQPSIAEEDLANPSRRLKTDESSDNLPSDHVQQESKLNSSQCGNIWKLEEGWQEPMISLLEKEHKSLAHGFHIEELVRQGSIDDY